MADRWLWTRGIRLLAVGVVAALLGLAVGCGGSSPQGNEGPEGDVIKMHANFELSGPGSLYGVSKVVGARVAVDEINEQGGVEVGGETYQIELIECDNRTEPTYGVQCAQEAADEEVLWTSAPDLGFEGAYEIYKENDILTIGNGGAASNLVNTALNENPLLTFEFLTYQQTVESNLIQLRHLYPDVERIATLYPNDANGQVQDRAYRELAPKYGFEVVAQELHPTDATGDFSSYLTTLGNADPEVIHLGYYPEVAAAAAEQGADLDVADVFTADGLTFDDLSGTDLGGKPFVGYQYAYNWFEGFQPEQERWRKLIRQFDEVSEGEPYLPSVVLLGYVGDVWMVKEAIEEADSLDPEKIAAAWPDVRYEGAFGPADGLDNRATDQSRTPFVVDENNNVTVYVFPTGLAEEPTDVIKVGERPTG